MHPFEEALADSLGGAAASPPARDRVLAPFTSLGIGGPADWFFDARSGASLRGALRAAQRLDLPAAILGSGSNLLIGDRGVRGLVVRVRGGSARRLDRRTVRAEAGMGLNALIRWTAARGLGGIEAWAGTPGTIGGAVNGNAHFAGEEIGGRIVSLRLLEPDGSVATVASDEVELAPGGGGLGRRAVLAADFRVRPGEDPDELRRRARASIGFRRRTQPLRARSAGCAFRNPVAGTIRLAPGVPAGAGALLDRAGLKGTAIGAVRVSRLHANFLLAGPGATASQVRELLGRCREAVKRRFGVSLEPEIGFLGEFER